MNDKTILIHSICALWPSFEYDLDLAQRFLDEGCVVTFLFCRGELNSCHANPHGKQRLCVECRSRRRRGIKWLASTCVAEEYLDGLTPEQEAAIAAASTRRFNDRNDLDQFHVEDSDIGRAALSTIMTRLRDPDPDLKKHRKLLRSLIEDAMRAHYSVKNHVSRHRPTKIIVYNGREAPLRPALRVGQGAGVETLVYERSFHDPQRMYITVNTYNQDMEYVSRSYERLFDESPLPFDEKRVSAEEWFDGRFRGQAEAGYPTFIERQQRGLLPASFNRDNFNIAIYNSSEDEFGAIPESRGIYQFQKDGIDAIARDLRIYPHVKVYLRVHPNLLGVDNCYMRELRLMVETHSNLELLAPNSPVSSYDLMDACDVVITFGSTIGIEACYRRKISILAGKHWFQTLGGVVKPEHHEDLIDILRNLIERGCDVRVPTEHQRYLAAIKYAFATKQSGVPFKYLRVANNGRNDCFILQKEGGRKVLKGFIAIRIANRLLDAAHSIMLRVLAAITNPRKVVRKLMLAVRPNVVRQGRV